MESIGNINWVAVIVGTVVTFLVGWAWYSPKLFGKRWAEGSGVSLNRPDKLPLFAMVTQLAALFLLALVIGITAMTDALLTAILAILAVAMFTASMGGFVQKSSYAITVDFFYIVVAGAIMILCQGAL